MLCYVGKNFRTEHGVRYSHAKAGKPGLMSLSVVLNQTIVRFRYHDRFTFAPIAGIF